MFSMCSELTPRARIPDTRIPQLMQPCSTVFGRLWLYLGEYLSKYLSAPIMGEWGIPEKILQNIVHTHWPCVNRTPQSKVLAKSPFLHYFIINCDTFPARSEQRLSRSIMTTMLDTHGRHRVFCQRPLIVKDGEKDGKTVKRREKDGDLIVLEEERGGCQAELKDLFSSCILSSTLVFDR